MSYIRYHEPRSASSRPNSDSAKSRRPGSTGGILVLVLLSGLLLLVPQNYVDLATPWRIVVQLAAVAGGLSFFFTARLLDRRKLSWLLLILVLLIVAGSLRSGQLIQTVTLLLPFVLGVSGGAVSRGRTITAAAIVSIFAFTLSVSLVLDLLMGAAWASSLFGAPHRLTLASDTRARGFAGQPVPAAMLAVALSGIALTLMRGQRMRAGALWRALLVASAVVALMATGTRSAVLVAASVIVGWIILRPRGPVRNRLAITVGALVAIVVLVVAYPAIERVLEGSRLLRFDALGGTESAINRLHALYILNVWSESCDVGCLVGYGPRSLELALKQTLGINGLATIDNAVVTLLWDFGLLGLTAFLAILLLILGVAFRKNRTSAECAGAVGLLSILVASFFFDVFYTTPMVLVAGFSAGLILSREKVEMLRD